MLGYRKYKSFYMAKAIVLAIFPLVLLLLPADFFDRGPDVCVFTLLSGYHCWGCGITRGCMHLIHLQWQKAYDYNKLTFIVLPILCGLVVADFRKSILRYRELKMAENAKAVPSE
jgi:Protein of unknown function (DUF2752)